MFKNEGNLDRVRILDLEVFANHGVFPEENALGQKFVISAVLYTDTRPAGQTDDLTLSVHYGEVSQRIREFVEGNTWKLLETVAEKLAFELLVSFPRVRKIRLEIRKPWAPVRLPLKTVAVEIERQWHRAYIALGSNMGEKREHLEHAVELLKETPGCRVTAVSDFITTAPYGYLEQDDFLNGCLELDTLLAPEELLFRLHEIEQSEKRERVIHWGPRTLDLDIIFYDDLVLDTDTLHIPHVEMHKRDFVLRPLAQIAPWKRHPLSGRTVAEMLDAVSGEEPEEK